MIIIDWISAVVSIEGPITVAKSAAWVQGYFMVTGLAVVAKYIVALTKQ